MKHFEKFTRKERKITALRITPQWVENFFGGKTHVRKTFFREGLVSYFIFAINTGSQITVEISIPRGKLIANEGDWIVKEINNKFSVYSDEEFRELTYIDYAKENKK